MPKGGFRKGARRARPGLGRVQLLACAGRLAELEAAGYGPVMMYEMLRDEGMLTLPYGTFYYNYRGRASPKARGPAAPASLRPQVAAGPAPPQRTPVDRAKQAETLKRMRQSIATNGGAWEAPESTR